ncbi:MAG: hypothetical protein ACR2ML_02935 [Solirubrobacteraceae bacterium]
MRGRLAPHNDDASGEDAVSGERLLPDPLDRPPEDDAPERPEPERPQPQPPWELEPTEQQTQPQSTQEQSDEPLGVEDDELAAGATPYVARFQLILGALLGIALVAVVAALLIGTGPSSGPPSDWSPWSPSSDKAGDAAQEIANHVAPSYRLDSGRQLVAITGGQLEVADLPVRLALAEQGRVSVLKGDGVLYTLCGLGPKCAIDSGLPSQKRALLLRREALEIALYTFRYVRGTDHVVALLPPRKGTEPTQAMFFRKDDLEGQLDRPLNVTLASPPPRSSALNAGDVSSLEALTARRLFGFKFEEGQDASVFLVLQPFAAG